MKKTKKLTGLLKKPNKLCEAKLLSLTWLVNIGQQKNILKNHTLRLKKNFFSFTERQTGFPDWAMSQTH